MSAPTLSVVIPVHNEEHYIGKCLDALLPQEEDLHEILVVDNNSTDSTADIVRSYLPAHPKLQLLEESRPGVAFARNHGFDRATGDILGRLDADSRAYHSWARTVRDFFVRNDNPSVGAISGLNNSYDSPFRTLKGWYTRKMVERGNFGGNREIDNLHGANMAVRRSVWDAVRAETSTEKDVHEDLDLALTIRERDIKILQLTDLMVDISPRRALTPPREITKYIESGTKTFSMHDKLTPGIEKALKVHWRFHALLYVLHRPYDPELGRYSLAYFRRNSPSRRLPVA